jgi:hypothetical protein
VIFRQGNYEWYYRVFRVVKQEKGGAFPKKTDLRHRIVKLVFPGNQDSELSHSEK